MPHINSHPYIFDNLKKVKRARFLELCYTGVIALVLAAALEKDSQNYPAIDGSSVVATNEVKINNPAFLKLLGKTEGFSEYFYMDNKGIAGAYGWNITQNSTSFNRQVGKLAGLSRAEIKQINKYSKMPISAVPFNISSIQIDEKKAQKTINFLYDFYMKEFETVFLKKSNQDYELLKQMRERFSPEQKAVFAHMSYKVGVSGLKKYENFYEAIFDYLGKSSPQKEDLEKIKNEIAYVYYVGKEKRRDTRVQDIHQEEFMLGMKKRFKTS